MKMKLYILSLVCIVLLQTACSGDDKYIDSGSIEVENQNINLVIDESGTNIFSFSTSVPWTISITDTAKVAWLSVSQTSGPSGTNKISITPTPNTTEWDRKGYLTIKSGNSEVSIGVIQGFWNGIEDISIADKNFRAYCLENFDTNKDGKLSFVEAKKIEILKINSLEIKSLNGIKYFTNLKNLNCEGNSLTDLDLSRNKKLTALLCSDNQIDKLDLSNNTNLQEIQVRYNNLTELNIGTNNYLKILACGYNNLKEIDLSSFSNLRTLEIINNPITTLDISYNTKLMSIYMGNTLLKEIWMKKEQVDIYGLYLQDIEVKYK